MRCYVVQRNQNGFSNGHPIHGEKNPCESIIEFNDLQVHQKKREDLHREGHPQHHHERQVKSLMKSRVIHDSL